MESFKDLLQKLQEIHEREVEGWQIKVKELSNKKGCDSKRMEELFTRNQTMKEQNRLLTENIKTLENRLRAGLCDRCTVTQEVAKRKQQEYEASRIQSLQHMSLLAGEMTNLKKENLRLKDEVRNLRAALEKGHSDNSSKNNNTADVKSNISPDLSPSPGVVCRMGNQTEDGDVGVKTEANHRSEETQRRHFRTTNQSSFEVFKPQPTAASVPWKTDPSVTHFGERSVEAFEPYSSIPVQPLQKTAVSSPDGKLNRTAIHAPIPCHPQPIKSNTISLPWPLSESSDWVTVASAGTSPAMQNSTRLHLPRYPSLIPPIPHTSTRRHSFGPSWPKPSVHQPPTKEPTVVFKLRRVPDYPESENKPPEKKENPPSRSERVSGEGVRETCDGPLDLSDRGKTKSSQTTNDDTPVTQRSPNNNINPPALSPSLVVLSSSSSCSTPAKTQEQESASDHHEVKEQEPKEEVVDKTDNGKKVPVLTLSLRPAVVRLESLNAALQKRESMPSNGKSLSSLNETESSLDEQEDESGSRQDNSQSCKRKRASVETETDRDSDTSNVHQERRFKITARTEESSPS